MALTQLAPPYPIFTDKTGDPLDAGFLYFGLVNQNPETQPIQIYYDADLTQPAAQPVRTVNGYPARNGSPATIYADSQFSMTVRNKSNELVIYSPVGYGIVPGTANTNTDQMTYNEGSVSAVDRVLTSRLQDFVSVKDFGAVGDGVTDDSAAVALAEAASDCVIFTADTYYMGASAWKPTANKTYIFQNTTLLFDVSNDAAVQIGMRTHFLGHLIVDANEAASSVALRFGPESGGVIGPCYDSVVDSVRVTGFTSVGIQFRSDGNSGVYYCKIGKAEVFNYSLNTSSPANADATAKAGIGVQFITDSGVGKVNSNLIEYATVIGYTTGVQVSNGEGNAFGYLNAETNLTMNLDIVEAFGFTVSAGRLENKCTIGFAGNLSIADGVDATGISINATITGFDQPTGALQAINFSNIRSVDIATQQYKYLLGRTFSENIEIGNSGTAKDDDSALDRLRVSGGQYCYRLSTGNPYYFFTAPTDGVGYIFRDNGSRILSQIDGGDPSSGLSSLRVLVNDGTNPVRLERVRIGAPDSGGTGYRALVINNS